MPGLAQQIRQLLLQRRHQVRGHLVVVPVASLPRIALGAGTFQLSLGCFDLLGGCHV